MLTITESEMGNTTSWPGAAGDKLKSRRIGISPHARVIALLTSAFTFLHDRICVNSGDYKLMGLRRMATSDSGAETAE